MTDPIRDAIEAVLAGELIVIPTDTVYGIAARPDDAAAVERLFEAKGRAREAALPMLVATPEEASRVAVFEHRARRLAAAFWPGPLTLVLPRTELSRSWHLGTEEGTIGVRIPRHPLAAAVLEGAGPLAVSSANRSGEPTPGGCEGLNEAFGDSVSVYLCEEEPLPGTASTVLDLTGAEACVIRAGAVDEEAIARVLAG